MSLKGFLIELLELNTEYNIYKSAGLSDSAAFDCALSDCEKNGRASGLDLDAEYAKIEERKRRLEKANAEIDERRRKLYEEHPWLVEWEKQNKKENSE